MIAYQPATPHWNSIQRPDCAECGTKMRLFGIEAERPGYELYSFECPNCDHIQVAIGKRSRLLNLRT
jgi:predicted RNA-binding Zn-ribbon protein involved in translation (DUF1610 family)